MAEIKYVSSSRLGYYDEKIKKFITDADTALKTNLEGQLDVVSNALDAEIERAKGAESTNAAAAKAADDKAEALSAKVGSVPNGKTVVQMISDAQNAATYDDTEVRGLISGLDTNKADKTQVATDIAAAVKAEEDARKEAVSGVQGAIDALSGTHGTDKAALEAAIEKKADKTALEGVSAVANAAATKAEFDEAVEALEGEDERIAGLVASEVERATGVEADFEERIATMEVFWDATEDSDGTINKLKEIQKYIADDTTGGLEMAADIQSNAEAIEAMDEAYKAADQTLQGNIDELAGVVAGKAAAGDVTALAGRMTTAEGKISVNEQDIATLKEAVGNGGSVADMIEDAVAAEAELRIAGDAAAEASAAAALAAANTADGKAVQAQKEVDALEGVVATKAAQSDLDGVSGRVTTAEGEIDTLQTEMDAVETLAAENKAAHEANAAAIAKKAEQTALQSETQRATGEEARIEAKIDAFKEITIAEIDDMFA